MDNYAIMASCLFLHIYSCLGDLAIDCGMNEKLENDRCVTCPQCPVGTGLSGPCGFGSGGYLTCDPCPSGFYNDDPTGSVCIPCTDCSGYHRRYKYECRDVIDAECGECVDGYYDDSKNLPYRAKLYACKRCKDDICYPVTQTSGTVTGSSVTRTLSHWRPIIATLVPLLLLTVLFGVLVFSKRGRRATTRYCNVLGQTCAGFCLKRSGSIFRRRQSRTQDEENLCAISGSGDGSVKDPSADTRGTVETNATAETPPVAETPGSAETSIGDIDDQRSDGSESIRRWSGDPDGMEPVLLHQPGVVSMMNNRDDDNQKSIVLKTKAIPYSGHSDDDPAPRQANGRNREVRNIFHDVAMDGSSSPDEERISRVKVPVDVAVYDDESFSDENTIEASSSSAPDPISQESFDELRTPFERSSSLFGDAYSEASTLLIRDHVQRQPSPSRGPRQQLLRLGSQLDDDDIEDEAENQVPDPVSAASQNDAHVGCTGDDLPTTKSGNNDAAGRNYSNNRHPRNRKDSEARNAGSDVLKDRIRGAAATDRPFSRATNVVEANGSASHILVNNGGVAIQVVNYLSRDEDDARVKDVLAPSGGVPEVDPSPPSGPVSDGDQTSVKLPVGGEYFRFVASSRRCRPKNEQSFPSFGHFPVQETCDGPPLSASSFK